MSKLTRKIVLAMITSTMETIRQWEAEGQPRTMWGGTSVLQMSEAVETALDNLCDLVSATSVDDNAKELVMSIGGVSRAFTDWAEAAAIAPDQTDPAGSAALRTELANLVSVIANEKPSKLPEPIRDLMDQGTNDEQICRIYGFFDPITRAVDMVKLAEEKANPGTHYKPDTFIQPHLLRRQREINEAFEDRPVKSHVRVGKPALKPRAVAPESIDTLLAQGIEPEQIAHMKNITVQEVEAHAAKRGIPLAGRTIPDPDKAGEIQRAREQRRAELKPQSHPEIEDMSERIAMCWMGGMKATDIAIALESDYPDLSWQRVNSMIQVWEKEEADRTAAEAK
ncbi:MAG: hypothetical protein ACO1RT_16165 [Planctomycetaceae bacterium]